jgi:Mn-dependent DtxR family transcriptional regulator
LDVICLETEAFYSLVEEVVSRIRERDQITTDKWISLEEAMDLLHVTSKSTMQKLRDEGLIRYSQPYKKIILYDRDSILEYIETHANETF